MDFVPSRANWRLGLFGIPGNQIPFAARIISVADTYSAITMARSYKPEKTHEEAIEILNRVEGKQLDTYLVSLFCTIPKEDVVACMERVKEKIRKQASVAELLKVWGGLGFQLFELMHTKSPCFEFLYAKKLSTSSCWLIFAYRNWIDVYFVCKRERAALRCHNDFAYKN